MTRNSPLFFACVIGLLLGACDGSNWGGDDDKEKKLAGERISVLDYDSSIKADSSLEGETIEIPKLTRNAEAPFDVAAQLAGVENYQVSGFDHVEHATVGDGATFSTILVPQPVAGEGKVFAMDAKGHVSAHDANDIGKVLWVSAAPVVVDEKEVSGGGVSYANGVVYVTTGYGDVIALVAKDGSVLWRRDVDAPFRAAPLAIDGQVYAISIDNQLHAFSARTGKLLWTHRSIKESAIYLGSVSPTYENGIVIAAYTSGEIYALRSSDGSPIWSDSLVLSKRTSAASDLTGIDATPVIKDGMVYGLSNSGLMSANALSNGRAAWEQEISGFNTPWVAGDYLFVLNNDNALMAVHRREGGVKWIKPLKLEDEDDKTKRKPRLSGPVMVNNLLAVASETGQMLFIDPQNGAEKTQADIPDGVKTAPIVANGTMYMMTSDAVLYSYR